LGVGQFNVSFERDFRVVKARSGALVNAPRRALEQLREAIGEPPRMVEVNVAANGDVIIDRNTVLAAPVLRPDGAGSLDDGRALEIAVAEAFESVTDAAAFDVTVTVTPTRYSVVHWAGGRPFEGAERLRPELERLRSFLGQPLKNVKLSVYPGLKQLDVNGRGFLDPRMRAALRSRA
jgi:hypothetical protein